MQATGHLQKHSLRLSGVSSAEAPARVELILFLAELILWVIFWCADENVAIFCLPIASWHNTLKPLLCF